MTGDAHCAGGLHERPGWLPSSSCLGGGCCCSPPGRVSVESGFKQRRGVGHRGGHREPRRCWTGTEVILQQVGNEVRVRLQEGSWSLHSGRPGEAGRGMSFVALRPLRPSLRRGHRGSEGASDARQVCGAIPVRLPRLWGEQAFRGAVETECDLSSSPLCVVISICPSSPAGCSWVSFRVAGGRNPFF